jgi:hypothetical protein
LITTPEGNVPRHVQVVVGNSFIDGFVVITAHVAVGIVADVSLIQRTFIYYTNIIFYWAYPKDVFYSTK